MRNKITSHKKPVTIITIIKTPIRAISKALNVYAKCVTNFSNAYNRPLMTMEVAPNCQQFPRSFSTSILSNNDQPVEGALVRSISTASGIRQGAQMKSNDFEVYMIQHHQLQLYASSKGVPRSCSVGMGKIDEDKVSSFRDDNIVLQTKLGVKDKDSVFSRSLTYQGVSTKRSKFV
ncbi:hypothetical protein L1987_65424 [Smallanthus sonchifolius]|uniref:Uncharacterized protein n=1 Tax=Smallanthus sonchifolius TaxID=185202 RepID=A0ACB9BUM9_9ASTR|nr:hypothetical protein L1987_65424 [Smallanthus sonchifolius]